MNNSYENSMDELMALVERLQKSTLKIVDINNYSKLIKAVNSIKSLLHQTVNEAVITAQIDTTFNLGTISVEASELIIQNASAFYDAVSECDNFDIYALINGNIRIDITFQRVLRSIL